MKLTSFELINYWSWSGFGVREFNIFHIGFMSYDNRNGEVEITLLGFGVYFQWVGAKK